MMTYGGTIKNYIIRNGNIKIFTNDSTKSKKVLKEQKENKKD